MKRQIGNARHSYENPGLILETSRYAVMDARGGVREG